MDDLRDYRYYADDLVHPNNAAIEYIWQKFSDNFLSEETKQIIKKLDPLIKAYQHKPLYPDTDTFKKFLEKRNKLSDKLKSDFPHLQWSNLIQL
jgi:hypothetical protein